MESISNLAGRQWLSSQMDFSTKDGLTKVEAIKNGRCLRCNAKVYAQLPSGKNIAELALVWEELWKAII